MAKKIPLPLRELVDEMPFVVEEEAPDRLTALLTFIENGIKVIDKCSKLLKDNFVVISRAALDDFETASI